MVRTSIESEHKDKIKKYEEQNVDNKIKKLNEIKNNQEQSTEINTILKQEREIFNLSKEITNISEQKDEIQYLLDVVPIINKYTDNTTCYEVTSSSFVNSTKGKEKGMLYSEFMSVVNNVQLNKLQKIDVYNCNTCNIPKILSTNDSMMICPQCGVTETYFDTSLNNLSYEQEINSEGNINFAYKRINHFNEWLAQFQAKESTEIPDEVINNLRNEFYKNKIRDTKQINKTKVKHFLKQLKYNKYYEHVSHITNLLTGTKPPHMSIEIEEKLRNMFRTIQEPFEKHKPKERLNFLSYSYCLYKFCELLDLDEFLCNFPLLKSREKLTQQDRIWKGICNELKWEYIPTV